jgi:hypothetical protein
MEAMMQTDATSWEVDSLIASDRVEGTPVRSAEGTMIGTIERIIIDKTSGNVSCAVLSFNGSVRTGRDRLAIPWHGLTYDRTTASYNLGLVENEYPGWIRETAAQKPSVALTEGFIGELPRLGEPRRSERPLGPEVLPDRNQAWKRFVSLGISAPIPCKSATMV